MILPYPNSNGINLTDVIERRDSISRGTSEKPRIHYLKNFLGGNDGSRASWRAQETTE